MARTLSPTFIPSAGAANLVPFEQIPEDIRTEAEEIYQTLKQNDGRIRVGFDNKAELDAYAAYLNSYCEQRPEELGGRIRFRRSPARGLPENTMDFKITDLKDEAETANANGNGATPAKKAPAKKVTTKA